MIAQEKHIIEKVHFRITAPSEKEAHNLKENVGDLLRDYILPYIEQYMDGLSNRTRHHSIRLDTCTISLRTNSASFRFQDVENGLEKQLDVQLGNRVEQLLSTKESVSEAFRSDQLTAPTERLWEGWMAFLKQGRIPWWLSSAEMDELLEEKQTWVLFTEKPERMAQFVRLFNQRSPARLRALNQFPTIFLLKMAHFAFHGRPDVSSDLNDAFVEWVASRTVPVSRVLELLFSLAEAHHSGASLTGLIQPRLQQFGLRPGKEQDRNDAEQIPMDAFAFGAWVHAFVTGNNSVAKEPIVKKAVDRPSEEVKIDGMQETRSTDVTDVLEEVEVRSDQEILQEGIYLDNAGLILAHPFLEHFFKTIGVIGVDGQLTDRELAVHCLHYIATGKEQDWEHNLLFEKYLCGIPLVESIRRELALSETIREECVRLMKALIDHWGALGNSTVDLLRHEFLMRPGKLFIDDVSPRLIIERRTPDILLDQLSWNISIVKLPWFERILYTTW